MLEGKEALQACRIDGGVEIRDSVMDAWLEKLPRQQRRTLLREAEKRGRDWLYRVLADAKMRARGGG